ncbi:MAG: thioredoxin domain-containing protein [Chloroflexota bacterium]
MANRLREETSPYLRQHAENPVDWYPWGEEALSRARQEDKPILLSIGYASCHWCHVMAHESFENPQTARLMNENFVNIKVDREERPDLDTIYMEAVQALTGSGGWPLTVFLTPDLKPYHGGTYFPPTARYNLPGFPELLAEMASDYRHKRREAENTAGWLLGQIKQGPLRGGELPDEDDLEVAYRGLRGAFDSTLGGLSGQPKFPQPPLWEFLLRLHARGLAPEGLSMVETTLREMAAGGIHDQIGGGFSRYSVDSRWTVPHFEKMLYDNAQLTRLYAHAYQATGKPTYRQVAESTVDFMLRELRAPEGGFYGAQDADSPGGEGAYYVWTPEEVKAVLGEAEGELAARYFAIGGRGNFEGKSIPTRRRSAEAVAAELKIDVAELATRAAAARQRLYEARLARPRPGTDTKVLAGWNGLALSGLAEAGAAFGRDDYLQAAEELGGFLRRELLSGDRLRHQTGKPDEGFLQDYAFVAEGFLDLYNATLRGEWLETARALAEAIVARFWSQPDQCFYDTGEGHEALIVRPRSLYDNALPAGGSAASLLLLRLAPIDGDEELRRLAQAAITPLVKVATRNPTGFGYWLCAFAFATATPQELAVVGDPDAPGTRALLAAARALYKPDLVVVGQQGAPGSPLLAERPAVDGQPTAYYCANFTCLPTATTPEQLHQVMGGAPKA